MQEGLDGRPFGPGPDKPMLALAVAHLLKLTPLDRPEPCCGYQNGCVCTSCELRGQAPVRPRRVALPWEMDAAA